MCVVAASAMTPTQLTLCTQSAATPQQSDEITKLVKKHGADWVPIAHNSRLTYTTGGEEELEAEEEEACFDSIAHDGHLLFSRFDPIDPIDHFHNRRNWRWKRRHALTVLPLVMLQCHPRPRPPMGHCPSLCNIPRGFGGCRRIRIQNIHYT